MQTNQYDLSAGREAILTNSYGGFMRLSNAEIGKGALGSREIRGNWSL